MPACGVPWTALLLAVLLPTVPCLADLPPAGGSVVIRNIRRVGFSNHARLLGVGRNEGQLADLFLDFP